MGSDHVRERILHLVGLAVRSRHVALGSDSVMRAIRGGSAKLVFVACDAGANSAKKYRDKCNFYRLPLVESFDRASLGRSCGRSEIVAIAVTDPGFAAKLVEYVGEFDGGDAFDQTSGV